MRLLLIGPVLLAGFAAAIAPAAVLVTFEEAQRMHAALAGKGAATFAAKRLRAAADEAMTRGPWSVTDSRPPRARDIDLHDYYSEGTYWWPDPANPNGKYIRKDGQTNPKRFMGNKNALTEMSAAVFSLGAAAYLFDDVRYAERANQVLRAWFVDPKTRMNPNLEHGQAIPGSNDGRGSGIIDTRWLIHAAQGMELLEWSGKSERAVNDVVRRWFADYTAWLTTSRKGLDEKKSGNNHATWWTAQVAAYSAVGCCRETQRMAFRWLREELFPKQVTAAGAAPREEARTKALGYSAFNLEAYAMTARMAQTAGVNLWDMRTADGATLATVIGYLLPSLREPQRWKKEQIVAFDNHGMYYLALAGLGMGRPEWVRAFQESERSAGAWLAFVDLLLAARP